MDNLVEDTLLKVTLNVDSFCVGADPDSAGCEPLSSLWLEQR